PRRRGRRSAVVCGDHGPAWEPGGRWRTKGTDGISTVVGVSPSVPADPTVAPDRGFPGAHERKSKSWLAGRRRGRMRADPLEESRRAPTMNHLDYEFDA